MLPLQGFLAAMKMEQVQTQLSEVELRGFLAEAQVAERPGASRDLGRCLL